MAAPKQPAALARTKRALKALKCARDRLTPKGAWIQETEAIDSEGNECTPYDPDAVQFCMLGALNACLGEKSEIDRGRSKLVYDPQLRACFGMARQTLVAHLDDDFETVPGWNDVEDRTQDEVLAVYDAAINDLVEKVRQLPVALR